jgi:hypothetical protein
MAPTAQPILEGSSTPHDIETRPKHQPTDAARSVLASLGVTDDVPLGIDIEPDVVTARRVDAVPPRTASPRRRTASPRKAAAPAKPKKVELVAEVCPRCFMQLPATGVCDNC